MALEQKLSVRMSQRLVMTPSLQQAIKLLQMSKLELVEEIQQELLENPVLEESQSDPGPAQESTADDHDDGPDPYGDIDYEAYFQHVEETAYTPRPRPELDAELPSFENTLTRAPNLTEHLEWQLDMSPGDERSREVGRAIIGNLNEDGYLRASLEEIQEMTGQPMAHVRDALERIQGFDPVGVAARDLVECLCVQLKHLGQEGTAAEKIVRHHLDKVQHRKYRELAEALGIEMDDLEAELEIIRGLDPRPGQRYNADSSRYVVPDVYIVKIDDEYQILLNEDGLPRLRVSSTYRRMVQKGNRTEGEAKEFVRNKLRSAFRLIRSLEERQRTIYKVATSIVKFQREFLDHGIERMRPLVLRDVADDIGMHESTVSRVVNNKYMHTHRGVFELRFFFHSGIATNRGGDSVSSLSVKEKIKKIIAAEDSRHPLSDAQIVKILKTDGLKIARRTVAKYREELKIPASNQRRQVFG
jgi:RNA polymerase sigma-54 factor